MNDEDQNALKGPPRIVIAVMIRVSALRYAVNSEQAQPLSMCLGELVDARRGGGRETSLCLSC